MLVLRIAAAAAYPSGLRVFDVLDRARLGDVEPCAPAGVVDERMRLAGLPVLELQPWLENRAALRHRVRVQVAVHVYRHLDVREFLLQPPDAGQELRAALDAVAL